MNILLCTYKILGFLQYVSLKDKYLKKKKKKPQYSPGEGNGDSPLYSCLENSMDRGAWWATIYGIAKSRT